MSRRIAILAVLLSVVGCRAKPLYTGPIFDLPAVDEFTNSDGVITQASFEASSARVDAVPVEIIDVRPGWQAQYYNGSMAPQDWEIARTIIPMDNFKPRVDQHLRVLIQKKLATLDRPPTSVEVRIKSFECVYDISADMKKQLNVEIKQELADFEQEKIDRRKERREDRRKDRESEKQMAKLRGEEYDDPSIGSQIVGGIVGGIFQGIFDAVADGSKTGKIKRGGTLPKFKASKNYQVVLAPDEQFRHEYPQGLSCLITAEVKSTWEDGTTSQAITTSEATVSSENGTLGVSDVVMDSLEIFATRLRRAYKDTPD